MKKIFVFLAGSTAVFALFFGFPSGSSAKEPVGVGEQVPEFQLLGLDGVPHSFSETKGKITMFHFWSAECPFVVRYNDRLNKIASDYAPKGVNVMGINSNVDETAGETKAELDKRAITYSILMDTDHQAADLFGAVTTPHVFIIDQSETLVYRGAVDDQGWSEDNQPTKSYVNEVLDALLEGKPSPHSDTKSVGCTVKRKKR